MYLRQWVTTINFVLVVFSIGMAQGHTAVLLQQLHPANVNITRTLRIEEGEIFGAPVITVTSMDFQSWIASSLVLFMCPGCWILAACSRRMGRKQILITAVAVMFASWLILVFSDNAYHILIGRSMSGLCMGILAGLTSVYQGECSIPKLRPILNAACAIAFSSGIGLCHAIGTWFHWRTTAFFCSLISLITLFMNYNMPESPVWLLNKHKLHEAIYSWTYLRGIRDLDELKSMYVEKSFKSSEKIESIKTGKKHCKRGFLKPLVIIVTLFAVSQLSGMGAVTFYCIQMITDISGPESAHIPMLILDSFRVLFAIVLVISSKRYSTRALTLFSAFNCSISLFVLSISILYKIWAPWLPLLTLFVFEAAVIMGLGPLPWTFCSELFSSSHKEVGIGITTSFNYILFFLVVKLNPFLFVFLQPWGTFFFYGICTFIGAISLYFMLPNTKNKSLKEIELMFSSD